LPDYKKRIFSLGIGRLKGPPLGGISLRTLRSVVQHVFFAIFTYGGRFNVYLGASIPCLACPYVPGCGGICYIRMLQSPAYGFGMAWPALVSDRGLQGLAAFLLFLALLLIFGKSWCGWICPFGLFQDWVAWVRKKLGVREAEFSERTKLYLKRLKEAILIYAALTPILISLGWVHPDMTLPFCAICPVKIIMPLFAGDATWLRLDFTNQVLLTLSAILIFFTGLTLVGTFFKTRFFCLICPMSALMHLFRPLFLLRLSKEPKACLGCATCRRVCPVDMDSSYGQRKKEIQDSGCQGCLTCSDNCSSDGALNLKFGPWAVFKSSRRHSSSL
jgi:polyferredoxin